ncbi:hypothetical protein LX95_00639 [Mesonia algae]|uniref:50S ribosomal protein L27 n=1 Tax=Mesonia algae TaxID=213248 RepID=A0A2W7IC97_9FLAO|nr:hypothetical protein [Mesonia algae]PZW44304.1 hypothetical protein LX95_00639 [Mesonia algae]
MYRAIYYLHSYWAYMVILVVFLATINALIGAFTKKPYGAKDFRISLFALICTHLQLLIGLILFFVSPKIVWFSENVDMGLIMKNSTMRMYNVEHPLLMIIAIVLITIGYSKHKKKLSSAPKFKTLAIFYTLAFAAILAMIPWSIWI